jgi:uncharacterized protein (DUF2062 family)/2-polyprenyl-3-methyl-5-hydroxy-6-metoxy-1,4-benzoquinol methylase
VGVGVLIGCSPFFGLHLWLGLLAAYLLRLNKLAVVLGAQISIPPVAPLLGFASVQAGAFLLRGQPTVLTADDFALARLPSVMEETIVDWMVGGLVLGAGLGLAAGIIAGAVVWSVRRRRGQGALQPAAIAEEWASWRTSLRVASGRYARVRGAHRWYAWSKLRMDPLYRLVHRGVGRGVSCAVDLGTGIGLLPVLLAVSGRAERVIGVDWDHQKVATGEAAARDLAEVELVVGDIRQQVIPAADLIVLADVLHYWPVDEQRELLRRAAAALRTGGRLVVRETDRAPRSRATRTLEAIAVRSGWNRAPGLVYRTASELRSDLEAAGLSCHLEQASSACHHGNVLIWGKRATADGAGGRAGSSLADR